MLLHRVGEHNDIVNVNPYKREVTLYRGHDPLKLAGQCFKTKQTAFELVLNSGPSESQEPPVVWCYIELMKQTFKIK